MRLKITNTTGRRAETTGRIAVVNAETGEPVEGVMSVSVRADESTFFEPVATIELEVDADVTAYGHLELKKVFA